MRSDAPRRLGISGREARRGGHSTSAVEAVG